MQYTITGQIWITPNEFIAITPEVRTLTEEQAEREYGPRRKEDSPTGTQYRSQSNYAGSRKTRETVLTPTGDTAMNHATTCAGCSETINTADVWYITANDDQRPYCDQCAETCDRCGTNDHIENLVEVFAHQSDGEYDRYHCAKCHAAK